MQKIGYSKLQEKLEVSRDQMWLKETKVKYLIKNTTTEWPRYADSMKVYDLSSITRASLKVGEHLGMALQTSVEIWRSINGDHGSRMEEDSDYAHEAVQCPENHLGSGG